VIRPCGPHNPAEWNHCQPTQVKIILSGSPLRETVTADGPIDLEGMFEVGSSLIAATDNTGEPTAIPPELFFKPRYTGGAGDDYSRSSNAFLLTADTRDARWR
jgi:hypothetical protein